jgi:hypothetical protein
MPKMTEIILKSQEQIFNETGMRVKLIPKKYDLTTESFLHQQWKPFCEFWGYSIEQLSVRSRNRELVIMRGILWTYTRIKYPNISLTSNAIALGISDHTIVIHGVNLCADLLETENIGFLSFYNPVKHLFL